MNLPVKFSLTEYVSCSYLRKQLGGSGNQIVSPLEGSSGFALWHFVKFDSPAAGGSPTNYIMILVFGKC